MTKEMYEDLLERNKLQISELNTLTEEQDCHIVELEEEIAELNTLTEEQDCHIVELEEEIAELNTLTEEQDRHIVELEEEIAELKEQNKDLCESLDIMNNRESELLDQIAKNEK